MCFILIRRGWPSFDNSTAPTTNILPDGLRPGEKLHEKPLIGEGLLTAPHPKILRAEERCLSELQMASALRTVRAAVSSGDAEAARQIVRDHVEAFAGLPCVAARQ